jgi:hypothetical protein
MATITHQYATRDHAQAGVERLRSMGIPDVDITVSDQASSDASSDQATVLVSAMVPDGQEAVARQALEMAQTERVPATQNVQAYNRAREGKPDDLRGADIAAMSGPGAIGYGAVGAPTGVTARAAAVGSAEELAGEVAADDVRGDESTSDSA